MPFFDYRARDKEGTLVRGRLEAPDTHSLEEALSRTGLIPIRVTPALRPGPSLASLKKYFQRIAPTDLILFSRQLATLFSAGVPLTRAFTALETQATNPVMKATIKSVREEVEGGSSFHNALRKHPDVFGELYANMIEAGEAGGILDEVLDRLALMLEKEAENRAKIKSATLYPKIVIGAIVVAIVVIMNFVVPRFGALYASFDVDLPIPTRALIAASDIFTSYWYLMLLLVAAVYISLKYYFSTPKGAFNRDLLILKVPVFGPLILKSLLARFSRVLGSMYRSGIPILQSLDIVTRAIDNRVVSRDIATIKDEVRAGRPLSIPMEESPYFPPMVVQMVSVGEETGALDEMLDKAAEYYEQEVDNSIRNLTTSIEPILLSIIFVIVLFMALAIFLPMWDIVKFVKR
jgi:type II secretory pathway component PulF